MGSSVDFLGVFDVWNDLYEKNGYTNHTPKKFRNFLGNFFVVPFKNQAAFCAAIRFRWYL